MPDKAHVTVDIGWWQALKAISDLAQSRDIERLSIHDVDKITAIAQTLLERLKEAKKVSQAVEIKEVVEDFVRCSNDILTAQDIFRAIERGEATFMGKKLLFENTKPKKWFVTYQCNSKQHEACHSPGGCACICHDKTSSGGSKAVWR